MKRVVTFYGKQYGSKGMPVSSIAQILLRIAALNWLIMGVSQMAFFFASTSQYPDVNLIGVISPIFLVAWSVLIWLISPKLSTLLAGKNDGEFNLGTISEGALMRVATFALGIFFMLNSFAEVFSWIHFFIMNKPAGNGIISAEEQNNIYEFTQPLLTLLGGLGLACFSKKIALKFNPARGADKNVS